MQAALKMVKEENDPIARARLFHGLLTYLDSDNAKEAFIALADSQRGKVGKRNANDHEMTLLLNAWGRVDGANAMKELATLKAGLRQNGTSLRGFIEDFSRRVFISEMLEIAVPGFLQPSVTLALRQVGWMVSPTSGG
ncbi:MAG: hypothetical protein ACI9DF_000552 [Verrucomicrobiales bacterium]|jgi:hypothetical protein